jgi:undecaprenyl pyrophosphate synthase
MFGSLPGGNVSSAIPTLASRQYHRSHPTCPPWRKAGPIPHHVAFIMDGNRRYACNRGVKVIQGQVDGFAALRRVRAQNRLCSFGNSAHMGTCVVNIRSPRSGVENLAPQRAPRQARCMAKCYRENSSLPACSLSSITKNNNR